MTDETVWHEAPFQLVPPVLITGGRAKDFGKLWRRKAASGWEYKQDEETDEHFADRQW